MDRFALCYTRGAASAIQDRTTGHRYDGTDLESLFNLLNELIIDNDSMVDDWKAERGTFRKDLEELEHELINQEHYTRGVIENLYNQIDNLEDEISRLQSQAREA